MLPLKGRINQFKKKGACVEPSDSRLRRNSNYFWHGLAMTRHTYHSLSLVRVYSKEEERASSHIDHCELLSVEFVAGSNSGICGRSVYACGARAALFIKHSPLVLLHTLCPGQACACLYLCFLCECMCVHAFACVCVSVCR